MFSELVLVLFNTGEYWEHIFKQCFSIATCGKSYEYSVRIQGDIMYKIYFVEIFKLNAKTQIRYSVYLLYKVIEKQHLRQVIFMWVLKNSNLKFNLKFKFLI